MRTKRVTAFLSMLAAGLASVAVAQAPTAHELALRSLIRDAQSGHVDYRSMTPELAEAVRPQAEVARAELTALGPLRSVAFVRFDSGGAEIYRTAFERGALEWAFAVDPKGLIANAKYRYVTPEPWGSYFSRGGG